MQKSIERIEKNIRFITQVNLKENNKILTLTFWLRIKSFKIVKVTVTNYEHFNYNNIVQSSTLLYIISTKTET